MKPHRTRPPFTALLFLIPFIVSAAPPLLTLPATQTEIGTGVNRVRVLRQNTDRTEVLLAMDYNYDGFGGPTAVIVPVVKKKGRAGVSAWFGCDPATIGQGKGTISVTIKYFSDEAGVPATFTSDTIEILILNSSRRVRIGGSTSLKTIVWGGVRAPSANAPPPVASDPKAEALAAAARAADTVRRAAEAEARSKAEAEERGRRAAEAKARDEKRAKEQAEALKAAQIKAEEEKQARLKADEEVRRLVLAREAAAQAEKEAALAAEAKAKETARLAAEAEAKSRADAEARDRQIAEQRAADERKAREETEALRALQARQEADKQARIKSEEEAGRLAAAREEKEKAGAAALPVDPSLKTRIANLDVVNRSLDRSEMTIGVEFEYKDSMRKPLLGVDVFRKGQPGVLGYFEAQAAEISKSRRNFVLVPVKFHPPNPVEEVYDSFATDEVAVYLQDGLEPRRDLAPTDLALSWHSPLARRREEAQVSRATLQIEDVRQSDLFSGYVAVKYMTASSSGRLRLLLFDSSNLKSLEWFATPELVLQTGSGLQLMKFSVRRDAPVAVDILKTDMIQVDLLNESGSPLASVSTNTPLTWARPK